MELTRQRIVKFLGAWANVNGSADALRLAKRFPEFHAVNCQVPEEITFPEVPNNFGGTVHKSHDWTKALQAAWREPDLRRKTWLLAQLLSKVMAPAVRRESLSRSNARYSPAVNVAIAMVYALRIPELLKVCSNPECPAPFFIKRRKNQALCGSLVCWQRAQRQWKREWWAAYGKAWRASRREKKSPENWKRKAKDELWN